MFYFIIFLLILLPPIALFSPFAYRFVKTQKQYSILMWVLMGTVIAITIAVISLVKYIH